MNRHVLALRPAGPDDVARLQRIDESARRRYRALPGLEVAATAPAIGAERFAAGETVVAAWDGEPVAFVLMQALDGLLYIANISVACGASGRGIGRRLIAVVEARAKERGLPAVTLATFKTPRWNGPWFRRHGYETMPETEIGPGLRAVLERHAAFLDMSARETLWKIRNSCWVAAIGRASKRAD